MLQYTCTCTSIGQKNTKQELQCTDVLMSHEQPKYEATQWGAYNKKL